MLRTTWERTLYILILAVLHVDIQAQNVTTQTPSTEQNLTSPPAVQEITTTPPSATGAANVSSSTTPAVSPTYSSTVKNVLDPNSTSVEASTSTMLTNSSVTPDTIASQTTLSPVTPTAISSEVTNTTGTPNSTMSTAGTTSANVTSNAMTTTEEPTTNYEAEIIKAIFQDYQQLQPPSAEHFTSNKSTIRIIVQRLRHISWLDERLQWNRQQYGGVNTIHVQPNDVWTPEVRYLESFQHYKEIAKQTADDSISIDSTGLITWITPGRPVDVPCQTDLYFFPFDYQDCNITVLSFPVAITAQPRPVVQTSSSAADMIPNIEWEVTSLSSQSASTPFLNRVYVKSTFTFRFARRSVTYWYTVIFPFIVFTLLPLCVFLLPVSSPQRITFALIQLVGFFVFTVYSKDIVPMGVTGSNEVPVIAQFFVSVICRIVLSVVLSCWSYGAYLEQGSGHSLTYCKRHLVVGCIGRVLGFGKEAKKIFDTSADEEKNDISMDVLDIPVTGESNTDNDSLIKNDGKLHSRLTLNAILAQIKGARRTLSYESEKKREKLKIHLEWQLYAVILDRLFLIVTFASVVVVAILFPLQYDLQIRIK
ncbi:neuronal acetylcholine receptor subunit alpha-5 isoform X2 [Lingula anatina]|uniref:Neuronal acetylcholine receptor subunit alpha-5 isoform X2 n=1 Tax=Lingula anatina TaxID=7574 RepID=A0A1S3IMG7_LINAN|nr:neuronal acetylcholine receptor subunit alpha-5 isoform X2 [Lingula anatina]|eukprot:XP_013399091.1 neuronal acetylcholine receptor subunit alpha-5 isoform X2 [Lingula anatina]